IFPLQLIKFMLSIYQKMTDKHIKMPIENNHKIETIETHLLRGQVTLLQPKVGFHASVDSVFLSAAVPVKSGQKILDIGCGVGSAGLCITLKKDNIILNGLDVQSDLIDIAQQNAELNNITDRAQFFCGNLLDDGGQVPDN